MRDVTSTYMDCIDKAVLDEEVRITEDVALMAYRVKEMRGSSQSAKTDNAAWPAAKTAMTDGGNHRWVDDKKCPGIWAIVDEGCNSGCHGEL